MAKPLNERIRAALSAGSRAATITDLIEVVKAEIDALETRLQLDEAESVNPLLETADQDEALARAETAKREIKKLSNSVELLTKTLNTRLNSDNAKAAKERYEAAKQERDAIAADLKTWGETMQPKLIDLLKRLVLNDIELHAVNSGPGEYLASAESVARGVPNNFYIGAWPVRRLTKVKLPAWDSGDIAWPDPEFWKTLPRNPAGGVW